MRFHSIANAGLFAAACIVGTADAQTKAQDPQAIWHAAETFAVEHTRPIAGEVSIEMAPVDKRLHLAACKALKPYLPQGARLWGRSHVGVRCEAPETWSLMVPVTVKVMGTALYSARPIPRGQSLTEADIESRSTDLTQLPAGILTDRHDALDKVANVALTAGLPLRKEMLKGATVVAAGEDVTITYAGNAVRVSTTGKALNNGAVGDSIQVRAASGKVLRTTVTAKGAVEVR